MSTPADLEKMLLRMHLGDGLTFPQIYRRCVQQWGVGVKREDLKTAILNLTASGGLQPVTLDVNQWQVATWRRPLTTDRRNFRI
jgi:hypothetical protein